MAIGNWQLANGNWQLAITGYWNKSKAKKLALGIW